MPDTLFIVTESFLACILLITRLSAGIFALFAGAFVRSLVPHLKWGNPFILALRTPQRCGISQEELLAASMCCHCECISFVFYSKTRLKSTSRGKRSFSIKAGVMCLQVGCRLGSSTPSVVPPVCSQPTCCFPGRCEMEPHCCWELV